MQIARLAEVESSPEGRDAARELAGLIVPDTPAEAFWTHAARALLAWAMVHQATEEPPEGRSLAGLAAVLNRADLQGLIRSAGDAPNLAAMEDRTWKSVVQTALGGLRTFQRA